MAMFKNDLFGNMQKETLFTSNETQVKRIENQIDMLDINSLRVNTTHKNTIQESRLKDLQESISNVGILTPLIVRINPNERGTYEILSGGHRFEVAKRLNLKEIPCIIKNVDDDTANIYWFDTNLQRNFDTMPKSEIALGIKLKVEAEKRQGKRTDLMELQELENQEEQDKPFDLSDRTISRYLRIAELIPALLEKLDNNLFGLRVAEIISYIKNEHQEILNNILNNNNFNIDIKKATLLKLNKNKLNVNLIYKILSDEYEEKPQKPKRKERSKIVRLEMSDLQGLIPEEILSDPEDDIKEYVLRILKNIKNADKH